MNESWSLFDLSKICDETINNNPLKKHACEKSHTDKDNGFILRDEEDFINNLKINVADSILNNAVIDEINDTIDFREKLKVISSGLENLTNPEREIFVSKLSNFEKLFTAKTESAYTKPYHIKIK